MKRNAQSCYSNLLRWALITLSLICLRLQADVIEGDTYPLINGWEFIRGDMGSSWEVFRPVPAAGKPEAVPLWKNVTLPHCFNAEDAVDPSCNYYQGVGWYRTVLPQSVMQHKGRVILEFEGAGQVTDVYVFLRRVAHHVGGYDEWHVDITDAVREAAQGEVKSEKRKVETEAPQREGGVPIAIRCDNSRNTQVIPSDMSDFNLYGGLYRNVNLVLAPSTHINDLRIDATVNERGKGVVAVSMDIVGDMLRDARAVVRVLDANGRQCAVGEVPQGESEKRKVKSEAPQGDMFLTLQKPHLWDVDAPYLYNIEISYTDSDGVKHTVNRKVGFRRYEFKENGPFMLNGRRLMLRGTHRHEDHAGVGAAMTYTMMRDEMLQMHDMGVNFIRLGHYQQSRRILDLCDSLGILVWEEIPWCRGGLGGEEYKSQARQMLRNMISQHRHHPSVILWGMGNENDWEGDFPTFDKDSIRAFMKKLVDISHALDPSRLTSIRRCDFCKDIVDVYSPSIWAGWYSNKFTAYYDMERRGFESVPRMLHAEWGADSHVGRHLEAPLKDFMNTERGDANGEWDETYAALLFDWTLKEQLRMPWLTGSAIWTFKDFSTPLRPTNPIPYVNQKGLVERDGTPKEAYYVVQSYWGKKPMAHIYGHSWPVRWGADGEKKQVWVYSNCHSVELILNGKSMGVKRRDANDYPAAGLHWDVTFSKGDNVMVALGRNDKGRVIVTDSLTQRYQTERWGAPHHIEVRMENEEVRMENGERQVLARVVDANGVECLDCNNVIRWGCTDESRLLTNQGTSTGSRVMQLSNGRSRITLLPGTETITVSATLPKSGVCGSIVVNPDNRFRETELTTWQFRQGNDGEWKTVTLPHSCNADDGQSKKYYRGDTYYKTPSIPLGGEERNAHLLFKSAAQKATILVNGNEAAVHKGGYTPFSVDITPWVKSGDNEIVVVCNNEMDLTMAPVSSDFNKNNGLHDKVILIREGDIVIDRNRMGYRGVHVVQKSIDSRHAVMGVRTHIVNTLQHEKGVNIRVEMMDAKGNVVVSRVSSCTLKAGEEYPFETEIGIDHPHLWQGKKDPYLYNVVLTIMDKRSVLQKVSARVGLRTVAIDNEKGFLLNGQPYTLRGFSMHQDKTGKASAVTQDDIDADFRIIEELGCNMLRLAHYPHNEYTFDKCDELGIIVQTEIPWVNECGNNSEAYSQREYADNLFSQYEEMIRNHFNHPCIAFWGMWNELGGTHANRPQGPLDKAFLVEMTDSLYRLGKHTLDPSRLYGFADMGFGMDIPELQQGRNYDYWGSNKYYGWYSDPQTPGNARNMGPYMDKVRQRGRAAAITEYGAGNNPKCHSSDPVATTQPSSGGARHDEEWANIVHEHHVALIKQRPWLIFTTSWVLFDFAVADRHEGIIVSNDGEYTAVDSTMMYLNDKGIVSRDRKTKKDAFYLYKAWWNPEKTVYITSKRYNVRKDESILLKVYSNATSLSLYCDGKPMQTLTSSGESTSLIWTFEPVPLKDARSFTVVGKYPDGSVCSDQWTVNN